MGNGAESNSTGNSDSKPKDKKRSLGEIIDFCAKAVVMIVGLPIRAAAAIVNQFVANGGAGRALVGGILFIGGSIISADSTWQLIFQGPPVFAWFEPTWNWLNVPFALFNPFFYLAFMISVGVQVIEAHALRGKNPDSARQKLRSRISHKTLEKRGQKLPKCILQNNPSSLKHDPK